MFNKCILTNSVIIPSICPKIKSLARDETNILEVVFHLNENFIILTHFYNYFADVTINDFANSTICKNRVKKSSTNVVHALKSLDISDKSWDETEYDDLDFVAEKNEDGTISYVMKKNDIRRRKKKSFTVTNDEINGNDYPLDIWFLISEYIRPEDVGRFAGICKSSYEVVQTAKFWYHLYKKYYKSVIKLPERLQPECMLRTYGVRTCVIRSLYYMYQPFVYRLNTISQYLKDSNPHVLTRRQCILMWYQKKKKKEWHYYFKLKERNMCMLKKNNDDHKLDIIEMLDDVSANAEEYCRILHVKCTNFIPVPLVQGLTLNSVSLTLAQGFTHQRLQLVFGSGIRSTSTSVLDGSSSNIILLDPVINVRVLDWWHPRYPHNHNIEHLLCQE